MAKHLPKPHERRSIITQALKSKRTIKEVASEGTFVISLRHLDQNQGAKIEEWEEQKILARAITTLQGYSHRTLTSQSNDGKFTIYGDFPPPKVTIFTHPGHIPEDAQWARIHVTGKQCLIGHVHGNTFFLVFLDTEHQFWISSKE